MNTYAIVNSGIVTNLIVWDGVTPYNPGPGNILVEVPAGLNVDIGWTYDGTNFHPA
jgi:hypothetical protein